MKVLKISLGGNFAHFGINGSNDKSNRYSFAHLPGSTLKGILGAVAGYKGWNDLEKKQVIPEFLEKLKDVSYGIIPSKPLFGSSYQTYNNTTGVSKADKGSVTLQVTEEILEEVLWDIYLMNLPSDLEERLLSNNSRAIVGLGKRGFLVNRFDVELLEGREETTTILDSIFPAELKGEPKEEDPFSFSEEVDLISEIDSVEFLYSTDFFKSTETFALTKEELKESVDVIKVDEKFIYMIGDVE